MEKHKAFVAMLRETLVVSEYEAEDDDFFREDLDEELESELKERFRKLFASLDAD